MSPTHIIFLFFALLVLSGAVVVVTSRNLVHAALCMALCFFGVAGLFVLLEASFLAVVAVLIGVGGISILIIFVIMLTPNMGRYMAGTSRRWPLSMTIVVIIFIGLVTMIMTVQWPTGLAPLPQDSIPILGAALVDSNQYLLPFELTSVLLVAALIGSLFASIGKE